MRSDEKGNLIFVQLFPDEEINEKMSEICVKHDIKTAVIVSCIGQIKKAKVGYFKKKGYYSTTTFEKPMEIISLTGNIIKHKKDFISHLHICLADENKNVYGGHFIEGFIGFTGEIIMLKSDVKMNWKINNHASASIP
jgi:predicted DNA-binding protein with PD1-like motif